MTFTKTSQKFGQWSDVRANTVYGLGFGSENELNKVPKHILNNHQYSILIIIAGDMRWAIDIDTNNELS